MLYRLQVLHLRSRDVSGAARGRTLRGIFYLRAGERLRHLLLFALILNFDIGRGRITWIVVRGRRLLVVVVHLAYLMKPILFGRVESLVRGTATRSLAMTGHSTLPGGLPTTLVPEENGRAVRIVCVHVIK